MQAGGQLGEWLAGTFAAAVAAATAPACRAKRPRRGRRRLDLRGDGDRDGRPVRHVGQRAGRGFPAGPAQSGAAVDRPHGRRHGRLLHHHRAAVPGLPGADRSRRPARRRRAGLVRRARRAPRRVRRHGHAVDPVPHHAGDRRPRGRLPDSGGPHRDARNAAEDRPFRRARRVRRIRGRRVAAAGAVSQRRDGDQAARAGPATRRRHRPGPLAAATRPARRRRLPTHFRWPTRG